MTHKTSTGGRIAGLDCWRTGLVLGGIFFHALPNDSDGLLFTPIAYLSSHFRMGAFFAISGFLTAIIAGSMGAKQWIRRRLDRLVPPLVTGAVLTVMSMAVLNHRSVHNTLEAAGVAFNWYHIWFLVALVAYLPVAVGVLFHHWGDRLRTHLSAAASTAGSVQAALLVSVSTACLAGLAIGAVLIPTDPVASETLLKYMPLALCYLPIFTAALLLGRYPDLREQCTGRMGLPVAAIAVLIGLEWLSVALFPPQWATGSLVIDRVTRAVLPVPAMLLILRSALSVRKAPQVARQISDASLTIYIVHVPVLTIVERAFEAFPLHPYVRYFTVVISGACYCWSFHRFVVRASPTLLWLFNGQPRARQPELQVRY